MYLLCIIFFYIIHIHSLLLNLTILSILTLIHINFILFHITIPIHLNLILNNIPNNNTPIHLTRSHQILLIRRHNTLINIIQMIRIALQVPMPNSRLTRILKYPNSTHLISHSNSLFPNRHNLINLILIIIISKHPLRLLRHLNPIRTPLRIMLHKQSVNLLQILQIYNRNLFKIILINQIIVVLSKVNILNRSRQITHLAQNLKVTIVSISIINLNFSLQILARI